MGHCTRDDEREGHDGPEDWGDAFLARSMMADVTDATTAAIIDGPPQPLPVWVEPLAQLVNEVPGVRVLGVILPEPCEPGPFDGVARLVVLGLTTMHDVYQLNHALIRALFDGAKPDTRSRQTHGLISRLLGESPGSAEWAALEKQLRRLYY